MRLALSLFGHEVIAISTEQEAEYEEDAGRDLSGGYLGSERIEVSTSDMTMGFMLGLDDE